jgi:hypothetical protein
MSPKHPAYRPQQRPPREGKIQPPNTTEVVPVVGYEDLFNLLEVTADAPSENPSYLFGAVMSLYVGLVLSSGGPFTGFAPLTVNLDSSLSTDANGNLVQVQWTFGDSSPISIEKKPQHVYVNSGSYTLKLKVIDSLGSYDIQTVQVSVQAVSP